MEGELNLEELTRTWREFGKKSSKEESERIWKKSLKEDGGGT